MAISIDLSGKNALVTGGTRGIGRAISQKLAEAGASTAAVYHTDSDSAQTSLSWYAWRRIMPALAEHYTVIAPDMRGCGNSSKPLTGYDKRTIAEDIHQLVQKLSGERIFLVGHDNGSIVAYAYAAAHPDAVRRLVVCE